MKICKVRDDSRRKVPLHAQLLIAPVGEDYSDEEEAKAVSADWDFYRFASKSFISPLGLSVQFIKYQVSDLGWVGLTLPLSTRFCLSSLELAERAE